MSFNTNWRWSEDRTINSLGSSNLTARDNKNVAIQVEIKKLTTGVLTHTILANTTIDDQKGESQNQRNDFSEGKLSGGLQTGYDMVDGVSVASRIHGQTVSGNRSLGQVSSPSSANTDTLGFGVYFNRSVFKGLFDMSMSTFEKHFLDYRRNANGLVDTMDPNVEKIVQELEQKDALALRWQGDIDIGRYHLKTKYTRKTNQHEYQNSGQGLKERLEDSLELQFACLVSSRDSVSIRYKFDWKWDNQRLKGAELFRGRQYEKRRELFFQWDRQLFANTNLVTKLHQGLSQTTAENQYNNNDRDRYSNDVYMQLESQLGSKFTTTMAFNAKRVEDLSIRAARSSNNNKKDTIELSPGYQYPLARWLTFTQSYRIFIQFTDYLFSNLEQVTRDDDYNKRGSLVTRATIKPTDQLTVTVAHEGSGKSDAKRTRTDASGNSYYQKNKHQNIAKLDLTVKFKASNWLTLEGATNRTWDVTDSFRGQEVSTTERNSGRVWLGCVLKTKIGKENPLNLDLTIKKFLAYGPNVRDASADYWDADISALEKDITHPHG